MKLEDIKSIYFIGIGGIGMSALARYFRHLGAQVHGYDRTATELTRALEAEGMHIHYEEDISRIPTEVDLVVWTPAVPADHKELVWLRERGYPIMKRAEVLGLISRNKRCIAIAGTHGKTTTSAMVAWILHDAGLEPTAFLGGIAVNFGSNFIFGEGDWVVVEADEYDRSFLHLHPDIIVINSLDPDHLDIYGTPEAMVEAYVQLVRQIKPDGAFLYKHGLPLQEAVEAARAAHCWVFTFGVEEGDFKAANIRVEDGRMIYDLLEGRMKWDTMYQFAPGKHNIQNAIGACAAAHFAGVQMNIMSRRLSRFLGVKRRFEFVVRKPDVVYVDDYAHHPAEIEATIQAARLLFPDRQITGVFQPHLYSRTRDFADAFAAALDQLDTCYLLPIYPAREQPIEGVDSKMLLDKMKLQDKMLLDKNTLLEQLAHRRPEVLLTMGAGDIDTLVKPIAHCLTGQTPEDYETL